MNEPPENSTGTVNQAGLNDRPALPVDFERNTMRRCLLLLLSSGLVSLAVIFGIWFRGGEAFRAVVSLIPVGGKMDIPTDEKIYVVLANLTILLTLVLYCLGLALFRLVPFGFRLRQDLRKLRARLEQVGPSSVDSLLQLIPAGIRRGGRLEGRVVMLERAYRLTATRAAVAEANNQLSALDEMATAYALQPFIWFEWLLPILGFIGTVYGITQAVQGLSSGISEFFTVRDLTPKVIEAFTNGFHGLAAAFQVTLMALWGLLFAGLVNFVLRMNASQTMASVDKWCHEAIGCLREEPSRLEEMLRTGLFQTDKKGDLVAKEDGKPVLRLQELLDGMQEMMRKGFFVTNERGELVAADGKPVLRWQEWMNQIARGFFVTDENGNLALNEHDRSPISRSAGWRRQVVRMLVNDIYEVTPEQAGAVAEGEIEETGETVPLRSRHERRHRELQQQINFLIYLLERAQGQAGTAKPSDGSAGEGPASFPVLQPTGLPVDALAVTAERFAIARQAAPASESDFRIHTGSFSAQVGGRFRQPVVNDDLAAPERVVGLSGLGDRLAYLCSQSGEFAVRGWEARQFPSSHCLNGGTQLVKSAVVLMPLEKLEQVVVGTQTDKEVQLLSWPADGSGPAPQAIKKMSGQISVFAGLPGRAAACVVGHDDGYKLCLVRDGSAPQETPIGHEVTALAFAPDGTLWFAEDKGNVGIFNTNTRSLEPRFDFKRRLKFLVATAAGQIVAAESGTAELFVAESSGQSVHALRCQNPLTALATSADGQNLLLGHQDGSVFYMDTRQKI